MSDFNERRINYLRTIRDNPKVTEKMLEAGNESDADIDSIKALIYPEDEKDLMFAETTYQTTNDLMEIAGRCVVGGIREIPVEENAAVKMIIQTINAIKEGKDKISFPEEYNTPEYAAKVLFDFTVLISGDPIETMDYIGNKTGFDLSDEDEFNEFKIYMESASEAVKELRPDIPQKAFADCTVEDLENGKKFALAFHKCFEENKKEPEIEDMGKAFAKLFMRALKRIDLDDLE